MKGEQRPYIQLVDAYSNGWTGFEPALGGYCKCDYTSPHPTS